MSSLLWPAVACFRQGDGSALLPAAGGGKAVPQASSLVALEPTFPSLMQTMKHLGNQGDDNDPNQLSYVPHSGWGNQMKALTNALFLSQALGRTMVIPRALKHADLTPGVCTEDSMRTQWSTETLLANYSEIAPYRPPVTNFITINNQHQRAPKVFSQQLHGPEDPCFSWCHDPAAWTSNSSWQERCRRPEGHCRGCRECMVLQPCKEKGESCFHVVKNQCADYKQLLTDVLPTLEAEDSPNLQLGSAFYLKAEPHVCTCAINYRQHLIDRVKGLAKGVLDGEYDALHLRLTEQRTRREIATDLVRSALNGNFSNRKAAHARPIFLASDDLDGALKFVEEVRGNATNKHRRLWKSRRIVTQRDFKLQQAKEVLGYLGPGAKQTSEFMRPLLIDLITVMESEELYPSPGSTFSAHAMEMRQCTDKGQKWGQKCSERGGCWAGLPLNLPVYSRACDAEDVQRLVARTRLDSAATSAREESTEEREGVWRSPPGGSARPEQSSSAPHGVSGSASRKDARNAGPAWRAAAQEMRKEPEQDLGLAREYASTASDAGRLVSPIVWGQDYGISQTPEIQWNDKRAKLQAGNTE